MAPRIVLAHHAEVVMREREIARAWIERTLAAPDWDVEDPNDPALRRSYAAIAERGGRVLRVVYRTDETDIFVVTVFFDRGARRP